MEWYNNNNKNVPSLLRFFYLLQKKTQRTENKLANIILIIIWNKESFDAVSNNKISILFLHNYLCVCLRIRQIIYSHRFYRYNMIIWLFFLIFFYIQLFCTLQTIFSMIFFSDQINKSTIDYTINSINVEQKKKWISKSNRW